MRTTDFTESKSEVYVDMDGVLADLFAHATNANKVKHWLDLSKAQWDEYYRGVDAYEMFVSLEPFATTDSVIKLVVDKFGHYNILSRPLEFDVEGTIRGKNQWVDNHLKQQPKNRFFTADKWRYATQPNGTPNILIDDHRQNIHLWQEHGGIGIKWQADEQSIGDLKSMLVQARNKFKS